MWVRGWEAQSSPIHHGGMACSVLACNVWTCPAQGACSAVIWAGATPQRTMRCTLHCANMGAEHRASSHPVHASSLSRAPMAATRASAAGHCAELRAPAEPKKLPALPPLPPQVQCQPAAGSGVAARRNVPRPALLAHLAKLLDGLEIKVIKEVVYKPARRESCWVNSASRRRPRLTQRWRFRRRALPAHATGGCCCLSHRC